MNSVLDYLLIDLYILFECITVLLFGRILVTIQQ